MTEANRLKVIYILNEDVDPAARQAMIRRLHQVPRFHACWRTPQVTIHRTRHGYDVRFDFATMLVQNVPIKTLSYRREKSCDDGERCRGLADVACAVVRHASRLRSTLALFHAGRMADRISRTSMLSRRRDASDRRDAGRSHPCMGSFYEKHSSHEARLLPWEADVVDRFVAPGADVLLIGSGSGRDLLALIERGCHVTGIDPSGPGLGVTERLLRARGLTASLIHGFFDDTPIPTPSTPSFFLITATPRFRWPPDASPH